MTVQNSTAGKMTGSSKTLVHVLNPIQSSTSQSTSLHHCCLAALLTSCARGDTICLRPCKLTIS